MTAKVREPRESPKTVEEAAGEGRNPSRPQQSLRRLYGGPGGGGCSEANVFGCFLRDQQLRDQQLGDTVAMK